MKDIFTFLDVDDTYIPDLSTRYNVSGIPKNKWLHNLMSSKNIVKTIAQPFVPRSIRQVIRKRNLDKPTLSREIQDDLINVYREDIMQLENLIGRDLSPWLKSH